MYIDSENGHYHVVELLLKQQADPNIQHRNGTIALYIVSLNGHDQVVELLLKEEANPNIKGEKN